MLADTAQIEAGNTADPRSKGGNKVRLATLDQIDGRTIAAKRTRDLIAAIELDLGGADSLSTAEKQIIQRAALTGALAEDLEAKWLAGAPIDPALYATLGNAQRRLFESVGLRRRAKLVPSLAEYLERKQLDDEVA
jgi:hypothetical protein